MVKLDRLNKKWSIASFDKGLFGIYQEDGFLIADMIMSRSIAQYICDIHNEMIDKPNTMGDDK